MKIESITSFVSATVAGGRFSSALLPTVATTIVFVVVLASSTVAHVGRRPGGLLPEPSGSGRRSAPAALHAVPARLTALRYRSRDRSPVAADVVASWCDALGRRLRSGDSLRHTLLTEHPEHQVLDTRTRPIRRAIEHGCVVVDAVVMPPDHPVARDPHLELLRSVLAAGADFGGSAAEPIDRVAATLRIRNADGQERAAQSAQARLSAHVLTVVPLGVLALLAVIDDEVGAVVGSPLGVTLIALGLALNLAGWTWMRRTIDGETS